MQAYPGYARPVAPTPEPPILLYIAWTYETAPDELQLGPTGAFVVLVQTTRHPRSPVLHGVLMAEAVASHAVTYRDEAWQWLILPKHPHELLARELITAPSDPHASTPTR
jgi:hypothetical protein